MVCARDHRYALNHCNPIVKKLSNIDLRCALSPMGANIALLRYLYDVSVPLYSRRGTVPEQVLIDHSSLWFNSESE